MMNLAKSKVALVTGAGTGIGRAAAKALLKGGYQVVLTGRNLDRLEKAIADIGGNQSNCLAVACDVGKPDEVKKLFTALSIVKVKIRWYIVLIVVILKINNLILLPIHKWYDFEKIFNHTFLL